MSPQIKMLLISSLTLNLFFSVQYLRQKETANDYVPDMPAMVAESVNADSAVLIPESVTADPRAYLETDFYPKLQNLLSRRFPGVKPQVLDLSDQRLHITLSGTVPVGTARETARSLVANALTGWAAGKPDFENRQIEVRFLDESD